MTNRGYRSPVIVGEGVFWDTGTFLHYAKDNGKTGCGLPLRLCYGGGLPESVYEIEGAWCCKRPGCKKAWAKWLEEHPELPED